MLAPEKVEQIRRLLAEGNHSQRRIARMLGVSRGTVLAIANNRRPDYEALRRARQEEEELALMQFSGPPRRCPECGGKVYMPCLACRARRWAEKHQRNRPRLSSVGREEPLGLNLREEHRLRYERVRARRERLAMRRNPPSDLTPPRQAAPYAHHSADTQADTQKVRSL